MLVTDVLIIGSEGAGARAAIAAHDAGADVLVVTKGRFGKSGATITALADIDVDSRSAREILKLPGNADDSQEIFFEDILKEGKFLNNQRILEPHVAEAPLRVKEMMDWGMKVKALIHTPGHRYPRGVYSSGAEIMKTLVKQVRTRKIKVLEDTMAVDLLTADGVVNGALGLNLRNGEFVPLAAKATMIATGGGMMVYPIQTAPEELTGDGQAIAYRAGAELIDMEMVQFHPCDLLWPPAWRGIGFPFTIGPSAGLDMWLLNKYGQRFMGNWDLERMEKTTRDILSIAIMTEVMEGRGTASGGVYMSLAHLPYNLVDYFLEWFSQRGSVGPNWKYQGFNFSELMEKVKRGYAMEVGPACHFFMGGIRVNEQCETSLPGLYAIGEVAGGTHGANRLSGNACTQIFVQGARGGENAARYAGSDGCVDLNKGQIERMEQRLLRYLQQDGGLRPLKARKELQKVAWEKAGIIREGGSLHDALEWIGDFKTNAMPRLATGATERQYNREWMEAMQIENLVIILEAITKSALLREESRGAHYRKDFKKMSEDWFRNIIIRNDHGEMSTVTRPIVTTRWKPEDALP
jgi:succinate dehydrogenase/fumarate reductase flavoprotein subunit